MKARVTSGGKVPMMFLENDDGTCIVKVYPNKDGTKIRFVLPELRESAQCVGYVDGPVKYLEFTRKL